MGLATSTGYARVPITPEPGSVLIDHGDTLLHILTFLSLHDLTSILRVSRALQSAGCSSTLPQWASITATPHRTDSDTLLHIISLPVFQYLRDITLDECTLVCPSVLLRLPRTVTSISLCNCTQVDLQNDQHIGILVALPRRLPALRKLELYNTLHSMDRPHPRLVASLPGMDLGRFGIGQLLFSLDELTCSIPEYYRCRGMVSNIPLHSNQVLRHLHGNTLERVVPLCGFHYSMTPHCTECLASFLDDSSVLASGVCIHCHDSRILADSNTWIDLTRPTEHGIADIVDISNLPRSLKRLPVEACNLSETLSSAHANGHRRGLLCYDDDSLCLYVDAAEIIDVDSGGYRNLTLAQHLWVHLLAVLTPIMQVLVIVTVFSTVIAGVSTATPEGADLAKDMEEAKAHSNTLEFLITSVVSTMALIGVLLLIWYRLRRYFANILSLIMALDFALVFIVGLAFLLHIIAVSLDVPVSSTTLLFVAYNFGIAGVFSLFTPLDKFSGFHRGYLVALSSLMGILVGITLSNYAILVFLCLPVCQGLLEVYSARSPHSNAFKSFLWVSPGSARLHTPPPYLVYEVPNTPIKLRSTDLIWYAVLVSFLSSTPLFILVQGSILILGSICTCIFVLPYLDVNESYSPVPMACLLVILLWVLHPSLSSLVSIT